MRYSQIITKTLKEAKEYDSVNATLLQKGGFVDQTMAGVYTYLPLGLRVLTKIEDIVREEMNEIATELLMPSLSPQSLWETTGRRESIDVLFEARGGNEPSRQVNDATYVLNSTHEELITPIIQQFRLSYKDLPTAVYQIQTKFRNEPRPKSGLLRGREFRMKDMYSFHASEEDFQEFYEQVKGVYMNIYKRLGIGDDTFITLASGGDFTKDYSHEFQTVCETGEDIIYHNTEEDVHYNHEVASEDLQKSAEGVKAAEVGNIFPLGTKYSDAFKYTITAQDGSSQPVYMGSYGLGTSRVMGVLVEKFHDDKGIIWPAAVAPFTIHLVSLNTDQENVKKKADETYNQLKEQGVEVFYDDRDASPGEKLADADLIGIPQRAVISAKTGDEIELKRRNSDSMDMVSIDELVGQAQN